MIEDDEDGPACMCCGGKLPRQTVPVVFEDKKPLTWEEAQAMCPSLILRILRDPATRFITRAFVWTGGYSDDLFCSHLCVDRFARGVARQMKDSLTVRETVPS